MKKLITICAVVTIAMLCLGTISTAQAYEFELGRTTYGDISHGSSSDGNVTTEYFTYSQDLSGPPEYEPSAFNFALSTDPHLWDYLYPGPYTNYNTHHLYQSSLNQFTINISMNQANVAAWDRDSSAGPSRNVLGCAWSISSPYYNSPLRGASITDFVLNGSEFSGTLVSDGGIHWAHSPNTADLTLYDYQDTFRFVGNMNDGSLIVYANTVSDCMFILAGDLNGDCRVDFKDLAILVNQWLQSPGSPSADIAPSPSGDGRVNFQDFAVMAANWLIDCDTNPSDPACVPK